MLVFRMLCRITLSSDAHRTESVTAMDHEETMGVNSKVLDQKQQTLKMSNTIKLYIIGGVGLAINRLWVQFLPGLSCVITFGKLLHLCASVIPGSRLPLLSSKPLVTFPAEERHRPSTSTKLYCFVTEARRCEQLAKCYYQNDIQTFTDNVICFSFRLLILFNTVHLYILFLSHPMQASF